MSANWNVRLVTDLAHKPRQEREFRYADHVPATEAYNRMIDLAQMAGWEHYHTDELPGLKVAHLRIIHKPRAGTSVATVDRATVTIARIGIYSNPRRAGKAHRAEVLRGAGASLAIRDETTGGR